MLSKQEIKAINKKNLEVLPKDRRNYTLRRHLGRAGGKFGFIQIRGYVTDSKQGDEVEYVNPATHTVILHNCILHNKLGRAIKIFDTKEKSPCAYVIFESYEVVALEDATTAKEVRYNPVLNPNWQVDGIDNNFAFIPCISSTMVEVNGVMKMKLFLK